MTDRTFVRAAGLAAILAAPVAIASFLLGPAAFGWDFNLLFDPERAIQHPTASPFLIRLGWMLDIPGYYLLMLPTVLVLHARSSAQAPLATRLSTVGALLYAITGTSGAAMLAGTTPLLDRFRSAPIATQAAIQEIHIAVFHFVVDGLWNLLCMTGLAVWSLLSGHLLRRTAPRLGLALMIIGVAAAVDVLGNTAGLGTLGEVGLFTYLFGFPAFSIAIGMMLLRETPSETM